MFFVIAEMYVIPYYIELCYNRIWLYMIVSDNTA